MRRPRYLLLLMLSVPEIGIPMDGRHIEAVERVYGFLGWPFSDEARARMQAFLAANPKDKHGAHRYTLEQFGLDGERLAARFRSYCTQFAIPVRHG